MMSWVYGNSYEWLAGEFSTEDACYDHVEGLGYPSYRQGYSGGALCYQKTPPPPPPPPPPAQREQVCSLPDSFPSQAAADEWYRTHELVTCAPPPAPLPYGSIPPCRGDYEDDGAGGCKLKPADGAIPSLCPRGAVYTPSVFELFSQKCDEGYTYSIDWLESKCKCGGTGGTVIDPIEDAQKGFDDMGLGSIMKMLPQLLVVMVIVSIIGAFRK